MVSYFALHNTIDNANSYANHIATLVMSGGGGGGILLCVWPFLLPVQAGRISCMLKLS